MSSPRWSVRGSAEGEPDGGAGSSRRVDVDPDPAAVELDDLLRERQADAGAGVVLAAVQPLEDDEHLVGVLGLDADAVVRDAELPVVAVATVSTRTAAATSGR